MFAFSDRAFRGRRPSVGDRGDYVHSCSYFAAAIPPLTGRMERRGARAGVAILVAVPLFAISLMLSAPPLTGLSVEPAWGDACAGAHTHPRQTTRRQARDAVVCLINNRRAARGKGRLDTKSSLRKAAGRHSRSMQRRSCRSHQCPGEKGLVARIMGTSYLPCNCSWGVAENIAWGKRNRGTPFKAVESWMNSPPHRHTLLDGDFRHIGVGITWRRSTALYTADFGYKRG